jgi:hypothetical protein
VGVALPPDPLAGCEEQALPSIRRKQSRRPEKMDER